jgi:glycosyltransferase involved in cell wall biosynthesis
MSEEIKENKPKLSKLALCMIVKDETDDLDRALKTVAQFVDGVFITHTSKDNEDKIREICKKYNATYNTFEWVDDFSKARNFAMSQITKEYTHMMWLDCDDAVLGGSFIPKEFKEMVELNQKALSAEYYYMITDLGRDHFFKTGRVMVDQLVQTHYRERIVSLGGEFEWAGKLHETLVPHTVEMDVGKTDSFKILHLADQKRIADSTVRNIRILEKAREEELKSGTADARTTFILARCYFDQMTEDGLKKAESLFMEHIDKSGWDEEICQSWNYLSNIYQVRGDLPNALKSGFEALKVDPRFPEVYSSIAMTYLLSNRWERAYFWAKKGLAMEDPVTTIVRKPLPTMSQLLLALAQSALKLNMLDESWAAFHKLNQLSPDRPEIKGFLMLTSDLVKEREVTKSYFDLSNLLSESEQKEKLSALVASIPSIYAGNPILSQLKRDYTEPIKWEDGSVVFYCGPGFELWSPENLSKGIGGSEEAVIYLAWEFAKKGRKVVVYGDPPVDKTYDGVEYKVHWDFNPKDEFDTLVIWRRPQLLDTKFKAKRILLDLHDVPISVEFTKDRVDRVSKVIVKSQYHREFIPDVPEDKIAVISNGINVDQLESITPEWKPGRLFYGSSYDRGLENLLAIWPDVRKEFPEAKLHIFYGWDLFDSAHRSNPERMAWRGRMQESMRQPGIINHGRVGQKELATSMSKCSIWAYPTTFEEINCITGIRAQALGLIPVINNYAALKETVRFGEVVPVDGQVKSHTQRKAYLKQLLVAMRNEKGYNREGMMRWSRETFSWDKIAEKWLKLLK